MGPWGIILLGALELGSQASAPDSAPLPAPATAPATVDDPTGASPATIPIGDAIDVRKGATCLDHERLVAQIRSWLDHERIDARLVVEVAGDAEQPRRLAFTLRRGDTVIAVRRFDPAPARCGDLHAVVGLAIALAVDATLLESVAGEPAAEPPPDTPAPEDDPPAVVGESTRPKPLPRPVTETPPRPPARRRAWSLHGELHGLFTINAPPGVGGGGRLGISLSWRSIVDLVPSAMVASSGRQPVGDGTGQMAIGAARLDVCAGPPLRRLRVRGCAGALAGAAVAAGQGFVRDQVGRAPWVGLSAGADILVRVAPRVGLAFGVEPVFTVVRPAFVAINRQGERAFVRFPSVAVALRAGVVIRLW